MKQYLNALKNNGLSRILSLAILSSTPAVFIYAGPAQNSITESRTVSGTVTDAQGEPVIGATVMIAGSNNGTATDINGSYTLKGVSGNSKLTISYVGCETQTVAVGNRHNIDIVLKSADTLMDELVVIGYGTVKKKDLTGAVSVADVDEMKKMSSTTVSQALTGQIAGVQVKSTGAPGETGKIYIRGISSLYSDTNPLFVIDGLPTSDTRDFNPADIESVQVLKDASAAAIYGSRAANGVVIITTKKGKEGTVKIDFSAKYGWQEAVKTYDLMDSQEWLGFQDLKYYNAGKAGTPGSPESYSNTFITDQTINHDWGKDIFRTGGYQEYNFTATGGNKTSNFMTSLNYLKNDGIVKDADFERITARVNGGTEKGIFSVRENILLSTSLSHDPMTGLTDYIRMTPVIPVFDNDGNYALGGYNGSETNGSNPVAQRDLSFKKNRSYRLQGMITGELRFTDWLKYQLNLGVEYNSNIYCEGQKEGKWYANQASQSSYKEERNTYLSTLIENILTFHKVFGNHDVQAMAGYTEQRFSNNRMWTKVYDINHEGGNYFWNIHNGVDGEPDQYIDKNALRSFLARIIYNYDDRYFLTASFRRDGSSRFRPGHNYGNFPSVSLAWKASNENFWQPVADVVNSFKVKASYGVLGNEAIGNYRYSTHLNAFVPYAYGQGNWGYGVIPSTIVDTNIGWEEKKSWNFGIEAGFLNNQLTIEADYFINESNKLLAQVPIPFYMGAFGNPLGDSLSKMWQNAGTVRNNGFELSLGWKDYSHEFGYDVKLNLYTISNKVKVLGGDNAPIYGNNTKTVAGGTLGEFFVLKTDGLYQMTDIYQTDSDGNLLKDADGKYIRRTDLPLIYGNEPQPGDVKYKDLYYTDENGRLVAGKRPIYDENGNITGYENGEINDDDREFAGSPWPKLEMSLNLAGSYKDFDLSMFWTSSFGRTVYDSSEYWLTNVGDNGNYSKKLTGNTWTEDNPTAYYPKAYYSGVTRTNSDRYLKKVNYLRLKDLQLGYNIPKKMLRTIGMESARIYFNVENLLTFTNYKGLDVEFPGGGPFDTGVDGNAYPCVRTYSFGIQVSF